MSRSLPWFLLLLLLSPIRAQQVRRNLEYVEKNGVTLKLVTPDMFQPDAVDDYNLPTNEYNHSQCQVFFNASNFMQSKGIVIDCNHIGWLDEGDWLAYSIPLNNNNTTTTTIYNLTMSITSPLGEGSFRVEDYETQEIYATVDSLAVTEDWNSFHPVTTSLNLTNIPNNTVTILIRSLSMGWTFHNLCLQEVISNATTPPMTMVPTTIELTTTKPTTTVPTVSSPPSSRPTNLPTLFQATETILPTAVVASSEVPTLVSSETPTKLVTPVPAVTTIPTTMPSSVPTLLSEMPSDVPTLEPTIPFVTTSTVVPSTYTPSMSDSPTHLYEAEYRKKSKKSHQPSGKGSAGNGRSSGKGISGKGSSSEKASSRKSNNSGKGSGLGKGNGIDSGLGKGGATYGKGSSSVSGKGSSRPGKEGVYGKGKGTRL
ncbi:hypothetical protein FisN_33Lh013 [Fistulifera solaris]|uniref:CBM6 domain-containing protein n=1 Tax=Fistulifera solaris TaxID=1519565 RepID=A0A1Z5KAE6_FISSO|nr:hypothetical protein FisN_33Lh013 [Fistulifera solaris]|eukprot:GAX23125.1 hypothetical protein FisN_33Lh013 [Fistulifera solaris]